MADLLDFVVALNEPALAAWMVQFGVAHDIVIVDIGHGAVTFNRPALDALMQLSFDQDGVIMLEDDDSALLWIQGTGYLVMPS